MQDATLTLLLAHTLTQGLVPVLLLWPRTYLNEYLTTFIEHEMTAVINALLCLCSLEERQQATNQKKLRNKMERVRQ